jgi:hypothetical protein
MFLYTAGMIVLLSVGTVGGLLRLAGINHSILTLLLMAVALVAARLIWVRLDREIARAAPITRFVELVPYFADVPVSMGYVFIQLAVVVTPAVMVTASTKPPRTETSYCAVSLPVTNAVP